MDAARKRVLEPAGARHSSRVPGPPDFLGSLAESTGLCVARLDDRLRVAQVNESFHHRFAHRHGAVRGRSVFEFLHPEVHTRLRFRFHDLGTGVKTWFAERVVAAGRLEGTLTGTIGAVHPAGYTVGFTVFLSLDPPGEDADETGDAEGTGDTVPDHVRLSDLSARVLERVAVGEPTPAIANELRLSRRGVEYHVGSLLRKLDAANRTALVSRAFTTGLFADTSWPPRVAGRYIQ